MAAGHALAGLVLGEKRRKAQRRVGPRAVNELAHQRADDERRRGHDERGPKLSHPVPRQPGQHTQVQQVDERHGAVADEPQRLFGGWPCIEPPDDGAILLCVHRGILPEIIVQYKNNILQKACQTAGGMFIMCLHTSPAWVAGKALFPPEAFRITAGLSPPRRGGQEGKREVCPFVWFCKWAAGVSGAGGCA